MDKVEQEEAKELKFYLIFLFIVLFLIFSIGLSILSLREKDYKELNISCITNKSILIISQTCGHCYNQQQILGEYKNQFKIYDISNYSENYINRVPTWIINNISYSGVKTLNELKNLSEC